MTDLPAIHASGAGPRSASAAAEPAIVVAGVTKCYDTSHPDVLALRGVDLIVGSGELVAIMGPSGCGKSTLLHLLGGLDSPTAGRISLAGNRLDSMSEAKRAILRRSTVGYVFQFFNLIANLTVLENVELPILLVGGSPSTARTRALELLGRLGVRDHAAKTPAALSGGQQQRVAMARALANEPAVLLADEPTGNLDSSAARSVLLLLRERHDAGQTIVMVTHDQRVAEAADRVVLMQDGAVTDTFDLQAGQSLPAALPSLVRTPPSAHEPGSVDNRDAMPGLDRGP